MRWPNLFDNNIKLEQLNISKIVKDVKLLNSFGKDENFKHPNIFEIIKDVKLSYFFENQLSILISLPKDEIALILKELFVVHQKFYLFLLMQYKNILKRNLINFVIFLVNK